MSPPAPPIWASRVPPRHLGVLGLGNETVDAQFEDRR